MNVPQPTLKTKLNSIRALVDADVTGVDIDSLVEKGKKLSQMMGLAAECKAAARKELDSARLAALIQIENKKYTPRMKQGSTSMQTGSTLVSRTNWIFTEA